MPSCGEAIDRATTDPRGPVHLECPGDVAALEWRDRARRATTARPRSCRRRARPCGSGVATCGCGSRRCSSRCCRTRGRRCCSSGSARAGRWMPRRIAALCASRGVPAMVTYKAKGVVPDTDVHFAGVFTNGAHRAGNRRRGRSPHWRRPRSGGAASTALDPSAADRQHHPVGGRRSARTVCRAAGHRRALGDAS